MLLAVLVGLVHGYPDQSNCEEVWPDVRVVDRHNHEIFDLFIVMPDLRLTGLKAATSLTILQVADRYAGPLNHIYIINCMAPETSPVENKYIPNIFISTINNNKNIYMT